MSDTLDRIAKVLYQAENASTPEEADAFMKKAQRIASAASIDLAVARAHQVNKQAREEVEVDHAVQVNTHNRKTNREHFMDLFLAVAEANDLRCTISGRRTFAFVTGFPSDRAVAEALFARLAVQMVSDCEAQMKAGAHWEWRNEPKRKRVPIADDDRDWGGWDGSGWYDYDDGGNNPPPKTQLVNVYDEEGHLVYERRQFSIVDGRAYRSNFYVGFTHATRIRLFKARQEARIRAGAEEESSGTALALLDKSKEVDSKFDEVLNRMKQLNPRGVGNYEGAQVSTYSSHGREDGAESANNARYAQDEISSSDRKALG
jgi:uncharacterized protein DUF2786